MANRERVKRRAWTVTKASKMAEVFKDRPKRSDETIRAYSRRISTTVELDALSVERAYYRYRKGQA